MTKIIMHITYIPNTQNDFCFHYAIRIENYTGFFKKYPETNLTIERPVGLRF